MYDIRSMSKRQTETFANMEITVLTKLGKLLFKFEVFLSVGQKLLLTLSKLFDFFKETLLCKKVSRGANFIVTLQSVNIGTLFTLLLAASKVATFSF